MFRCTNRKYNITTKLSQNLKWVISIHGETITKLLKKKMLQNKKKR
jgi:hypothetical protein